MHKGYGKMTKIAIIGGGASGMAAGITASRNGASVTVLEQNDILGKKILSTGNGRCNLTNLNMKTDDYRGDDLEFIQEFLKDFGASDALDFFSSVGIFTKCRGDYVYPLSDQASAVRDALAMELHRLEANVRINCYVEEIRKGKKGFLIFCAGEQSPCRADKVILAAGSKASQVPGSNGSGYVLAERFGHTLSPVVPSLVQLISQKKCFKKLSGIRITAQVSLYVDGKLTARDTGELQLTDYGVSGIPVFQVSRYAAKALNKKQKAAAAIDFIPHLDTEELTGELLRRRSLWKKRTAAELLNTIFPSKLIPVLLSEAGLDKQTWAEKISENQIRKLSEVCKCFTVPVSDTKSFSRAQVCAGGVRTDEVCPHTMESKLVKGLYITGELLDVDGICGGYNLHFAWGSGIKAGKHAAGKK